MSTRFWQRSWWQPPHFYGLKVVSVILALIVWGYVTVTQNPLTEATFSVPVEIRNLASDLAQPDTNYQVQVRVQATAGVIEDLTSYDMAAYVDLTDMVAGEATPMINIELPANVSLVSRSPESLDLTLYPKVSQTFPLTVNLSGQPEEGFSALDPVIDPEIVTLSGSDAYISQVGTVYVTADLAGLSENYSKSLAVEVLSSSGENITDRFTCYPSTVSLLVPVVQEQPDSYLPVRCSYSGEPAEGYKISRVVVEPAAVQAFADQDTLDGIYYLETESVDVSGLSATASFTAQIKAPAGVSLSRDSVTVVVQIEAINSATFTCALSDLRNAPSGLNCVCSVSTCSVTLSGTDTYLQALSAGDIRLYLDLSSVTQPGSYELPVHCELPGGVSLGDIAPDTVTVTVTSGGEEE